MKTMLKNLSLMLALLMSLCSCLEFDIWVNPISDVQDAKVDKRLIGTWVSSENPKSKNMTHIYEIDEHTVYLLHVNPADICEQEYDVAHTSEVDGRTFLNWRKFDCSKKEFSKYSIFEYEFNGENEVSFYATDDEFVEKAIQNKRLSGNVEETMVVTATSPEIREFIKNSPKEKLFYRDDPLILKRFERPKVAKKSICILF